jgi:hypothetical protein
MYKEKATEIENVSRDRLFVPPFEIIFNSKLLEI